MLHTGKREKKIEQMWVCVCVYWNCFIRVFWFVRCCHFCMNKMFIIMKGGLKGWLICSIRVVLEFLVGIEQIVGVEGCVWLRWCLLNSGNTNSEIYRGNLLFFLNISTEKYMFVRLIKFLLLKNKDLIERKTIIFEKLYLWSDNFELAKNVHSNGSTFQLKKKSNSKLSHEK